MMFKIVIFLIIYFDVISFENIDIKYIVLYRNDVDIIIF